jgi:hypothetical protein
MSQSDKTGSDHRVFPIFIDEVKYDLPQAEMTGEALRNLLQPPLAADRDLWLETPGPRDDLLIRVGQTYEIKPGSKFYTAPSTINPGAP